MSAGVDLQLLHRLTVFGRTTVQVTLAGAALSQVARAVAAIQLLFGRLTVEHLVQSVDRRQGSSQRRLSYVVFFWWRDNRG